MKRGASRNALFASAQSSAPAPVYRVGASLAPSPRAGHAARVERWRSDARELVRSCCPSADDRAVQSAAEKIVKMLLRVWAAEGIK